MVVSNWRNELDELAGATARLAECQVDMDDAQQARDSLKTISNELRRQMKSIETRIETSVSQALRAVGPMNDERFKTLIDERAIRVYPTKMRDVADRYGWEKQNVASTSH